ncbi:hypothetical protein Ddye_007141 [Dipteronia dyeriana]|uniref:Thioredoxin domain-containing protein n=1 Tax=Dipteronia dyeriana TaxID=168575 RepID=A0AAD9XKE1_9ROSI|nr:hypothetical protein Ddye_007141 [Dipteronia dyeriana]
MAHEQEGQVINCHTVVSWNDHLQKGFESKKLIVVDFLAAWCAPCRLIEPIFNELARKMPYAIFLKVDVNELKVIKVYMIK